MLKKITLVAVLIALGFLSYTYYQKTQTSKNEALQEETLPLPEDSLEFVFSGDEDTFCYLLKEATPPEYAENAFNYTFFKFQNLPENKVEGVLHSYPYGTDSGRAHFTGTKTQQGEEFLLSGKETILAEGTIFTENAEYLQTPGYLVLGNDNTNPDLFKLPKVSCDEYEKAMKEYNESWMMYSHNPEDKTRFNALLEKLEVPTEEQVRLNFFETQIDIDDNYETEEYLVYIYGPYVCGTGGCNLFVVNAQGEILSETTVTDLPIYAPVNIPEGSQSKDLIVWSDNAYRRLEFKDGMYPKNASLAPEISHNEIVYHPEKYYLLLDYIN